MSKARRVCFDRILPRDLRRQHRVLEVASGRMRAISRMGREWINGGTIRISFLDGNPAQKDKVKEIAVEWTNYANLYFEFTDSPSAEIRVTFNPNDGSWSYVGTDNLEIPIHAATLNLAWLDEGTILHQFGHMIGLVHQHQNPDGGIVWNEQVVIRELAGPPNYWDEATTRQHVLYKYSADQLQGTDFDPDSIMLYPIPPEWTMGGGDTHVNEKLSDLDKQFVRSAMMYPPTDSREPKSK